MRAWVDESRLGVGAGLYQALMLMYEAIGFSPEASNIIFGWESEHAEAAMQRARS